MRDPGFGPPRLHIEELRFFAGLEQTGSHCPSTHWAGQGNRWQCLSSRGLGRRRRPLPGLQGARVWR